MHFFSAFFVLEWLEMAKKLTVILIVLSLIFGNILFVISNNKPLQKKSTNPLPVPKEATILLDKNGFSPKEVIIKVGTAVRWKNMTDEKQTVNSDNYPTNQLHKELNVGVFNANSSVVKIFTKSGTYGYHNQFIPEQKGLVIVKP
jgi:plastocyanin